jgi:hypothetical protein
VEASEKPRLPLTLDQAPDEGDGVVRALDDRLVIERLTVDDAGTARVVREQAEQGRTPVETVTAAVEIGTRVIDSEGTVANVDYVRRELESGLGELDRRLQGTLETGSEELAERISAAFGSDRSDSVQAQIRQIVAAATQDQREALMRIFSSEDGSNPLIAFQARMGKALAESDERHRQEMTKVREQHATAERAMRNEVTGLREQLARMLEKHDADERVAEAEDAGTRKGRTFEELVYAELERIAGARGDAAHAVGAASSEAGGKKGDVVIEIEGAEGPPRARLVFEAKNKRLSKNDAWAELNAAIDERDASFALLVVAGEEKIPSGTDEVVEYQGNKMIVVLDHDDPDPIGLAYAYRYARARALMVGEADLSVDAAGVRDSAEQAAAALKRANAIRKALTGVTKGAETARGQLDEMIAEVDRCLTRIESLIDDAGEP